MYFACPIFRVIGTRPRSMTPNDATKKAKRNWCRSRRRWQRRQRWNMSMWHGKYVEIIMCKTSIRMKLLKWCGAWEKANACKRTHSHQLIAYSQSHFAFRKEILSFSIVGFCFRNEVFEETAQIRKLRWSSNWIGPAMIYLPLLRQRAQTQFHWVNAGQCRHESYEYNGIEISCDFYALPFDRFSRKWITAIAASAVFSERV